ncbi:hypothetical protein VTL71DRAFT_14809 [Oculimacula yallundae]|uniref:Uncharacterized protein n=1 Tax=Oculimacula yallundae TaxID=86028 RepID=A0ABR4CLU0_9HELO
MSTKSIQTRWESIEQWEAGYQKVDQIIQEDSGHGGYIQTKSLPPFGMSPGLSDETITKLKAINGLVVEVRDEE